MKKMAVKVNIFFYNSTKNLQFQQNTSNIKCWVEFSTVAFKICFKDFFGCLGMGISLLKKVRRLKVYREC